MDPTTLLTDMSANPLMAALTVTANSGADVPMATMVKPIARSDIRSLWAMRTAESTTHSDPFHNNTIDIAVNGTTSSKVII